MKRVCSIFSQIHQLMPRDRFEAAVEKHQAERHARGFSSWGQFVAMLFCRLGQAKSNTQLFQQFQEPLHRSSRFDAHEHWTFQSRTKLAYCLAFVGNRLVGELAAFGVHHGYGCCLACRSKPTIFISASFVPSLLVGYRKVYSGRREADVVMTSVIRACLPFVKEKPPSHRAASSAGKSGLEGL